MIEFDTPAGRTALKDAMTDALRDNRDWFRELVQEALLEVATAEARREADLRAAHAERQRPHAIPHGRA
jgi:hypothetical protein